MTFKRCCVLSALACVLGVLSGCATIYEGRYAFNDGWRKAQVEEVGTASTLRGAAPSDCHNRATGDRNICIAVDFDHLRRRIVALPAHTRFEAGDAAYVKLRNCFGDVVPQRH